MPQNDKTVARPDLIHILIKLSLILALAVSAVFVVGAVFVFHDDEWILSQMSRGMQALLFTGAAAGWFLLWRLLCFLTKSIPFRHVRYIGILACVLAVAVQLCFVFFSGNAYKWDALYVIGAAGSLVKQGEITHPGILHYAEIYPNQHAFLCLTAVLIRVAEVFRVSSVHMHVLFDLVNLICIDLGCFFTLRFLCAFRNERELHGAERRKENKESGKEKAETEKAETEEMGKEEAGRRKLRILLFLLCNPFLYLCVTYYYTITVSFPFCMAATYLLFRRSDRKYGEVICRIAAGVLFGVAYALRPTAVIFLLAAVLAWLFAKRKKLFDLCVPFCFIVTVLFVHTISSAYVGLDTEDKAFPTSHWIMMSLTAPGTHNAEDEAYTNSFATKEEKREMVKKRLTEKWSAMTAHDVLSLARDKMEIVFFDGTHGYLSFRSDGVRSDGMYEALYGMHRDPTVVLLQGYQVFLFFGLLLFVFRALRRLKKEGRVPSESLFLAYVFLGAVCFYLLWEAAGNYYLPFLFIFAAAAYAGLEEGAAHEVYVRSVHIEPVISVCLIVLFWGTVLGHVPALLEKETEYEHPVSSQIVGFEETEVGDGEMLTQDMTLSEVGNHLILQWKNPAGAENNAVYEMRFFLGDTMVLCETIEAGEDYNGIGDYTFATTLETGRARIEIEKIAGDAGKTLSFVTCSAPGVSPYYGGELKRRGAGGTEVLDGRSLLFAFRETRLECYTRPKRLMAFGLALSFAFIIMGFCSTIVGVRSRRPR